nr:glycosyltransferase family 2 protein [Prevotella sp.]
NDHFIERYLQTEGQLVYGGYTADGTPTPSLQHNLRYRYEQAHRLNHSAEVRSQQPYHDFHTSNFLVERRLMVAHPFDERFRHYGYEDVLWGKQLKQNGISITHIDNPLSFCHYEDNDHFVGKTEEGLRTLATFRHELRGFSPLLAHYETIERLHLGFLLRFSYKMAGKTLRKSLIHNNPPLFLFNIYKLLYFAHYIKKTDK